MQRSEPSVAEGGGGGGLESTELSHSSVLLSEPLWPAVPVVALATLTPVPKRAWWLEKP